MIILAASVLASCCLNVVFLEILIRQDPGCGNLVTFCQFFVISLEGFFFTIDCGRKKPVIPISNYVVLVVMFFVVSVSNNYALYFNISMPLHMIFKSGSLIANLFLGIMLLKHRYSVAKYLSVGMVTLGIIIATISSQNLKETKVPSESGGVEEPIYSSLIGISLLTCALLTSANLGIYQETLFSKYGKHSKEALFYSHALSMPGFLPLVKDIYNHGLILSSSGDVLLPLIGNVPLMMLCLLGNAFTQYICIRSVFEMTARYSSLTVTMLITLRKFISLVFSILYFKNPFTISHWAATFLVFAGSLLFADIPKRIYYQMLKKKKQS